MKISSTLKNIGFGLVALTAFSGLVTFWYPEHLTIVVSFLGLGAVIAAISLLYVAHFQIAAPIRDHQRHWQEFHEGSVSEFEFNEEPNTEIGQLFHEIKEHLNTTLNTANKVNAVNTQLTRLISHSYFTARVYSSKSEEALKRSSTGVEQVLEIIEEHNHVIQLSCSTQAQLEEATEIATRSINSVAQFVDMSNQAAQKILAQSENIERMNSKGKELLSALSLIEEVATQTSLLSLNASIEAARAGDAGRGFAVVASEVRSLADKSQSAAETIGQTLKENAVIASDASSEMQDIVNQTQSMLTNLGDASSSQAGLLEDIALAQRTLDSIIAATINQSGIVQTIATGLDQGTSAARDTSKGATEFGHVVHDMMKLCDLLQGIANDNLLIAKEFNGEAEAYATAQVDFNPAHHINTSIEQEQSRAS